MVKTSILFIVISLNSIWAQDAYERNCVTCHQTLPTSLQEMFKRYLLVYSGEKNVKASIKHYLTYPNKSISAMSDLFVDTYGIKKPTHLNKVELNEAIDIYWDKFKVFNKLK